MSSNAPLCCGAFSLTVGVELICLVNLLFAICIIATISSVEPMSLGNINVSPSVQVMVAAWAAAGIPLVVGAGIGIVYRVEVFLRAYFWYFVSSVVIEGLWFMKFLVNGSVCSTIAPRDLERLGTTFVCGLTDTFALFWGLICIGISAYFLYIVWAAMEDIRKGYWPELMRYRDAWRLSADALPKTPAPMARSQMPMSFKAPSMPVGFPVGSMPQYGSMPQSVYGSVPVMTRPASPPLSPRQFQSFPNFAAPTSMGPSFVPSPHPSWTPVVTSSILL